MIAAVLRDNVKLELGLQTIYPNVYILLLSKASSNTRKGTPLKIGLKLLQKVDATRIFSGRKSFQGILKGLAEVYTRKSDGKVFAGASALLYSEELSSSFVQDQQLVDTITDWFDYHSRWDNTLSAMDSVRGLENVCITMLSAANEANVDSLYDRRAAKGGLLARTLVVAESKRRHKDSLMFAPKRADDNELFMRLKEISQLKGNFTLDEDAKVEYDKWYMSVEDEDFTDSGVEGRIGTIILKVAMIYSAAERVDKIITKRNIRAALDDCLGLMVNTRKLSTGRGTAPTAEISAKIMRSLFEAKDHTLKVQVVMRALLGEVTKESFDLAIETLQASALVVVVPVENEVCLVLQPIALEMYEKAKEKLARKKARG